MMLTHVAVMAETATLPPESLVRLPARHAEHLSGLVNDNPAVVQTLGAWRNAFAELQPESFRALA